MKRTIRRALTSAAVLNSALVSRALAQYSDSKYPDLSIAYGNFEVMTVAKPAWYYLFTKPLVVLITVPLFVASGLAIFLIRRHKNKLNANSRID